MNNRTKMEQFFILLVLCVGFFSVFALSGCGGGKSCETIKCSSSDEVSGVSIPGCGGCLSLGKGCNSCGNCLWAQSYKVSCGNWENEDEDFSANIVGCDARYYAGGCLGCGQDENSCYSGCINVEGDDEMHGFFYGSTDKEEKVIGCYNGCGGCVADGNIGGAILYDMERSAGID